MGHEKMLRPNLNAPLQICFRCQVPSGLARAHLSMQIFRSCVQGDSLESKYRVVWSMMTIPQSALHVRLMSDT
jgi:hypothetical protein